MVPIYSSFVDVAAPADRALVRTLSNTSANTQSFEGTSASAPHVTGIAALMMSYWNDATNKLAPEDVERVLELTAIDKVVRPSAVGRDNFTGWGMVNAEAAVAIIDKTEVNLRHSKVVPTPADITQMPSTTSLYVYEVGGSFLNTRYEADVYKVVTLGASYRDPRGRRPYYGAWVRNSSSSFYGPPATYYGFVGDCPTCPACPSCTQALEVEQNVTYTFAGKTGIFLTGYVYHLTAYYDPVSGTRVSTDTWLPANYNPGVGGGQMDYSVLQGRDLRNSPFRNSRTGATSDEGAESVSTSDGKYAVVAYPNPTQNQLQLLLPPTVGNSPATVTVMTVTGQAVKAEVVATSSGELTLSIRDLPDGLYLYRVVTGQGSYCGKFVKAGQL